MHSSGPVRSPFGALFVEVVFECLLIDVELCAVGEAELRLFGLRNVQISSFGALGQVDACQNICGIWDVEAKLDCA